MLSVGVPEVAVSPVKPRAVFGAAEKIAGIVEGQKRQRRPMRPESGVLTARASLSSQSGRVLPRRSRTAYASLLSVDSGLSPSAGVDV